MIILVTSIILQNMVWNRRSQKILENHNYGHKKLHSSLICLQSFIISAYLICISTYHFTQDLKTNSSYSSYASEMLNIFMFHTKTKHGLKRNEICCNFEVF